ncbi:MAG: hypothetical protein J3Q66DRAFT_408793 [Benniella sp.]|nr:MAG: hypothetical protein J3Q66DRAFT_408793 [Benniella sp.]
MTHIGRLPRVSEQSPRSIRSAEARGSSFVGIVHDGPELLGDVLVQLLCSFLATSSSLLLLVTSSSLLPVSRTPVYALFVKAGLAFDLEDGGQPPFIHCWTSRREGGGGLLRSSRIHAPWCSTRCVSRYSLFVTAPPVLFGQVAIRCNVGWLIRAVGIMLWLEEDLACKTERVAGPYGWTVGPLWAADGFKPPLGRLWVGEDLKRGLDGMYDA